MRQWVVAVGAGEQRAVVARVPVVAVAAVHLVVVPGGGLVGSGPVGVRLEHAVDGGQLGQGRHRQALALPVASVVLVRPGAGHVLAGGAAEVVRAGAEPLLAVAGAHVRALGLVQVRLLVVRGVVEPAARVRAGALAAVRPLPAGGAGAGVGGAAAADALHAARDLPRAAGDRVGRVAAVPARALLAVPVGGVPVGVTGAQARLGVADAPVAAVLVLLGARPVLGHHHLGRVGGRGVREGRGVRPQQGHVPEVLREGHEGGRARERAHGVRALHGDALVRHRAQRLQRLLHVVRAGVVLEAGGGLPPEAQREVAPVGRALELLLLVVLEAVGVEGRARERVVARGAVPKAAVVAEPAVVAGAAHHHLRVPLGLVNVHVVLGGGGGPEARVLQAGVVLHALAGTVAAAVVRAGDPLAGLALEAVAADALPGVGVAQAHVAALHFGMCLVCVCGKVCPGFALGTFPETAVSTIEPIIAFTDSVNAVSLPIAMTRAW
mmetsp:Transcript_31246/g.51011  ORF Transcript_31246/g.51011 Transcript_31246/m.51011 type:complete len:494 (-) Transcript_31246:152-1633(-)